MQATHSRVELVADILQNYADRGVFRGFSRGNVRGGKATFKMQWHRDQLFEMILDVDKKTMHFPMVLPEVPARSPMDRQFKEFVESRHSKELPEHRRIDTRKARLKAGSRAGNTSVTMTVKGIDFDYGTRKLIHAVHEIYLTFLSDGRYFDYMVEVFDLDPDRF